MKYIGIFIASFVSSMIFTVGLQICKAADRELQMIDEKKQKTAKVVVFFFLILAAVMDTSGSGREVVSGIAYVVAVGKGLFWASMALAAYSDYCTLQVWDFVYLPAVAVGICQVVFSSLSAPGLFMAEVFWDLLIYIGFQWLFMRVLFRGRYGESDCIAFSVCALYLAGKGGTLLQYTMHMAAAYLLLGIVQFFKKNISKHGDLKQNVAFIPYIAAAMLICG